jgi:DNA-binding SARP family transcriptional activator
MLSITLFGSPRFELQVSGKTQLLRLSPRCAELLAFLGIHKGQSFPRRDLVETIWNEQITETTIGSFNTTLWRLRRSLEAPNCSPDQYLVSDRRGIGLSGSAPIEVDTSRFESRARQEVIKEASQATEADYAVLQQLTLLYKDTPLAGYSNTWALRCREALGIACVDILERLMAWNGQNSKYAEAIANARRILQIDPLREDVHGALMRYFTLNGQRTLALRQFETCRDLLQRELAISPLPQTVALYRQIAQDSLRALATLPSLQGGPERHIGQRDPQPSPEATYGLPCQLRMLREKIAEIDRCLHAMEANLIPEDLNGDSPPSPYSGPAISKR